MVHGSRPDTSPSSDDSLATVIDSLAHLLPAQGPISIFIHHNTLHAFEHVPFEEAVEHAAVRLDREPYLAEPRYRDKLASGRIRPKDVEALLAEQLGATAVEDVAGVGSWLDLSIKASRTGPCPGGTKAFTAAFWRSTTRRWRRSAGVGPGRFPASSPTTTRRNGPPSTRSHTPSLSSVFMTTSARSI